MYDEFIPRHVGGQPFWIRSKGNIAQCDTLGDDKYQVFNAYTLASLEDHVKKGANFRIQKQKQKGRNVKLDGYFLIKSPA